MRRFLSELAVVVGIAFAVTVTTITLVTPVHRCHGWVKVPPRNQMSDLRGGDRTVWLCRSRPR